MSTYRPFGTWHSPITPADVTHRASISDLAWDSDGETLIWAEQHGDRTLLMAQTADDAPRFLTDGSPSPRGGVGYGGGGFTAAGGAVYFVAGGKQLHRMAIAGGAPIPITPDFGRAASPTVSPDGRFVVYVHQDGGTDRLMVVDSAGALLPRIFAAGEDFYMQPTFSADGAMLAYITWNQPTMPFDGTRLRLAHLGIESGLPVIHQQRDLAGGDDTAILQPSFASDGRLAYVSDESGWWQIHLYDPRDGSTRQITHAPAEHGIPAWVQGVRVYAWSADETHLYALRNERGKTTLWAYDTRRADPDNGREVTVTAEYDQLRQIAAAPGRDRIAVIAAATTLPERLISVTIGPPDTVRVHARTRSEARRSAWSIGEPVTWTGHDGETVHGWYYPPFSETYHGADAPPLIVDIHGGPTGQSRQGFDAEVQYFTSRGFAWLAVNYRGSTGYGKAYKDKLRGMWGVYDVEDAASGALALVDRGLADRDKLILTGGSSGGFTVLQSLVVLPGLYAAGVCLYGIGEQVALALNDAWKFEAAYPVTLLGPLPDALDVYRERSPLHQADRIRDPLLIFHGAQDEVVPIAQAEQIVAALRRRGVTHEYHVYKDEGHGFGRPDNVAHYLETTVRFLTTHVLLK